MPAWPDDWGSERKEFERNHVPGLFALWANPKFNGFASKQIVAQGSHFYCLNMIATKFEHEKWECVIRSIDRYGNLRWPIGPDSYFGYSWLK